MSDAALPSPTPWATLATLWEELFPLRPARVELCLGLAPAGARTLDAGCATGSLPRALAARGRRAQGLDLDPSFLAVARRRAQAEGLDIAWHEASLLDLAGTAGPERFRLVTCLGQTLPHLLEEAQWLDFFRQARQVLEPGGHLVIQAVHDGSAEVGRVRELPPLRIPAGVLERRRTVLSPARAAFETRFTPEGGAPVTSRVEHRVMAPGRAAELLREAGFHPEPPSADEAGNPFLETSPGWVLRAG